MKSSNSPANAVLFTKYSGCGNDFILVDDRTASFPISTQLVAHLCHRQQGIGADGIILVSSSDKADFRMRIFNADGTEAEMCGNGLRCAVSFAHEKMICQEKATVETLAGLLEGHVLEGTVAVRLSEPLYFRTHPLQIGGREYEFYAMTLGVPHAVCFVEDVEEVALEDWGPIVRRHPSFGAAGTNVNVVQCCQSGLRIRTYERGVEAETLACGTGAAASAVAAVAKGLLQSPVCVEVRSGELLRVSFDYEKGSVHHLWQVGSAKKVYEGRIEVFS